MVNEPMGWPGLDSPVGELQVPASYVIYQAKGKVYADSLRNDGKDFSGTDAATVMRSTATALSATGGTISQIAKNSVNLLNANLSGQATVWLEPTESVIVTYATATAVMNKDRK